MIHRREHFRSGLIPVYAGRYDVLCSLLGPEWQPYCGTRTFKEQTALYAKKDGTTHAKAGESAHNYGAASDWCLWDINGKPLWQEKGDPRWIPYLDACQKSGLLCLEFERPHNELPLYPHNGYNSPWQAVHEQFEIFGISAALAYIKTNVRR